MGIGSQIKEHRIKAGLTQAQLAEKLGVATITIRQYESEKREPRFEQQQKIATALDIPVTKLLVLEDRNQYDDIINELLDKIRRLDEKDRDSLKQVLFSIEEEGERRGFNPLGTAIREHYENANRTRMNTAFDQMNATGQQVAADRVEELSQIPAYQKKED